MKHLNEKLINNIDLRKSVKSSYIIESIFSILSKKKKLSLITYNKKFQSKFEINIEHFKTNCERYIIRDKIGKGKEYDKKDKLIFEGEYLNGKKNGYGKEYDEEGKLIFEGKYLNGKGKEYFKNIKLRFEFIYLDGEKRR